MQEHFVPAINEHFRYLEYFLGADGDLASAYDDMLRLQKTFRIPVTSLARGWWGSERTTPLNVSDVIAIAEICVDREDMDGALEWLLQVRVGKCVALRGFVSDNRKNFDLDREVEKERSSWREKQTQVPQPARQRLPSSVNHAQTSIVVR